MLMLKLKFNSNEEIQEIIEDVNKEVVQAVSGENAKNDQNNKC